MIKIDLHMHTGEDPDDGLRYPAIALVNKAVELGFGAIAITLHGKVLDDERLFAYARAEGLLLIPAVEWNIEGRDVLLYNITQSDAERILSFDDLRAYKRRRGDDLLVIAPHPYYLKGHCLGRELERNIDLFDAVEYSQMHLSWLNPAERARRIAQRHGKPIVANSDAHNLRMFGRHYTLVDAEPTMPSIFRAIRENRVRWHSPHLSVRECMRMFICDPLQRNRPGQIVASFDCHDSK